MDKTSIGTEEDVKQSFEPANAICRGCLTTNRKMISAAVFGSLYKDLTGIIVSKDYKYTSIITNEHMIKVITFV